MTVASPANTDDRREAFTVAKAFVEAIVWGEHVHVWELLSPEGREHVLRAASRKGLDAVAAERARQNTWSTEEADTFLTALLHGLRVDLSGVDLDQILVAEQPQRLDDGSLQFHLECPSTLPSLLTRGANWAAGAVVVAPTPKRNEKPTWRVTRLIARPATRAET